MNRLRHTTRFLASGFAAGILLSVFAFLIAHSPSPITPPAVQAVAGTAVFTGTSSELTGDITASRLLDQANTAYYIDPAASGTSLVTAGSVGIGTSTITEKFNVSGNIGFTGGPKIIDSSGKLQLQAGGTGTGSTGTGSIYFLNSGGSSSGRFDTTSCCIGATGGTITYSGGYTIHTFTSSGTFTPGAAGNVEYLVVGGGGGGGGLGYAGSGSGGGGAGGFRTATGFAVTAQAYTITVGAGGSGGIGTSRGSNGEDSIFSSITSTGGGGGGNEPSPNGGNGGSGGGAVPTTGTPGNGTGGQGNNGGAKATSLYWGGGGGGGASAAGSTGIPDGSGNGGAGTASSISGSSVTYAGGGGGGVYYSGNGGSGGSGGGGAGGTQAVRNGSNGTANTGGGGGGSSPNNTVGSYNGGNGGSGIVIVRYLTYGALYLSSTNTSSADLAEYYVSGDGTIEAGDVVAISNVKVQRTNENGETEEVISQGVLRKADKPYDQKLIGIISTNPGLLLGSIDGDSGKENKRMLALAGRVPVKIDPDSAAFDAGDFLTSSTKPGYAMKATRPGYVVGRALESWSCQLSAVSCQPTIDAFLQLTYYMGDIDPFGNLRTLEVDTLKVNKTLEVGGVNVLDEINNLKKRLEVLENKQ